MNYLEKNLNWLKENNISLYNNIITLKNHNLIEQKNSGFKIFQYNIWKNINDKESFFIDDLEPLENTIRLSNNINKNSSKSILVNLLNNKNIYELLEKNNDILIYEDNIETIYNSFKTIDFSNYTDKNIYFAYTNFHLTESFDKFIDQNLHLNYNIIIYHDSKKSTENKKYELIGLLNSHFNVSFEYYISNLKNTVNNIENNHRYLPMIKIDDLNSPVLLLSPGPSLEKNIKWIKENEQNFIIAAVGSSLNILFKQNIKPDIVFSLDIKKRIYKQFDTIDKEYLKDILFISSEGTDPNVLKYFKNTLLIPTNQVQDTVNHMALNVLLNIGQKIILTIGNDSSISNGNIYSNNVLGNLEYKERKENLINVKGNLSERVTTNLEFFNYIKSYTQLLKSFDEKSFDIFNLSDGAYIEGMAPLDIKNIDTNLFKNISNEKNKYIFQLISRGQRPDFFPSINNELKNWEGLNREIKIINLDNDYISYSEKINTILSNLNYNNCSEVLKNVLYRLNRIAMNNKFEDVKEIYISAIYNIIENYINSIKKLTKLHKPKKLYQFIELKNNNFELSNLNKFNNIKFDVTLKELLEKKRKIIFEKTKNTEMEIISKIYFDTLEFNFDTALENVLFEFTTHEKQILKLKALYMFFKDKSFSELFKNQYKKIDLMFNNILNIEHLDSMNEDILIDYLKIHSKYHVKIFTYLDQNEKSIFKEFLTFIKSNDNIIFTYHNKPIFNCLFINYSSLFKESYDIVESELSFNEYENYSINLEIIYQTINNDLITKQNKTKIENKVLHCIENILDSKDSSSNSYLKNRTLLEYYKLFNGSNKKIKKFDNEINDYTLFKSDLKFSKKSQELINMYEKMAINGYERIDNSIVENAFSDFESRFYKEKILPFTKEYNIKTILDYGCGGSNWYRKGFDEKSFDSAIEYYNLQKAFMYEPARNIDERQKVDCVISFDVLEHIFISDVPNVIREMFEMTEKLLILNVACYPAAAKLPNGENAHITVRNPIWWKGVIDTISIEYPDISIVLFCSPKWRESIIYKTWKANDWQSNKNFVID